MRHDRTMGLAVALLLVLPVTALATDSDGDGVDDAIDVCCETPPAISVDPEGRPLGDLDGDCDVDQDDFGIMQRNFTGPKPPGEGPCPIECLTSDDCLADQFCTKPEGECDVTGLCQPRPLTCPDIWDPVCGCDGETYSNECDANAAGTTVDYPGTCRQPCTDSNECAETDYCAKPEGACHAEGVCEPRPVTCPDLWDPVCGCDGLTYDNECWAARAGVSVDYAGPCKASDCKTNDDCPATNDYCAKDTGDCEGIGQCKEKPTMCLPVWDPVCGCDGRTYGNACEAAAAGVSAAYTGECRR